MIADIDSVLDLDDNDVFIDELETSKFSDAIKKLMTEPMMCSEITQVDFVEFVEDDPPGSPCCCADDDIEP